MITRAEVTPTGRTLKGPDFFMRTYGAGVKEFPLTEVMYGIEVDYRKILETAGYFGYDPRNHYGRFANQRRK